MRGKIALVSLVVGYVLHVVDVGFDIYVAIQYSIRGEWWWFSLTLVFIILPLLVANFSVCFLPLETVFRLWILYRDAIRTWKEENWNNPPCERNDWRCSCEICKNFHEKRKKSVESIRELSETCYIETIAEAAPQWCLQSYIMLRQWFFPWYTILSIIFSFLSLACSITTHEKAEKLYEWYVNKKKLRNYPLSPLYVTFFAWQLCSLFSRLPALVIFAYVFRYYVFIVFGVHWMVLIVVSYVLNKDENNYTAGFYYTCVSYPALFHISGNVSKLVLGDDFQYRGMAIIVYHVLLSLQNIVLVSLAVWVTPPRITHMEDLETLALSAVFLGSIAATLFMILYYRYHHPSDLAQLGEDNNINEQQNHSGTENLASSTA